jgi:DNA-binding IclR family transcriptional regulator
MARAEMNGSTTKDVKSASRILDILELLALADGSLSLVDVCRALTLPKSSAFMLLSTLITKGYATRDGQGLYSLDPIFADAGGWIGGQTAVLRRLARPVMRDLVERIQETVILGGLTNDLKVKVLEKFASPREVRYDMEVTTLRPAYCTAMGRVILAHSGEDMINHYMRTVPMPKLTEQTIVEPQAFRADLAEIRDHGYAINIEARVHGASGVATPVFNARGHILGALNVGCVTSSFVSNRETIIENLLASARQLNDSLAPARR